MIARPECLWGRSWTIEKVFFAQFDVCGRFSQVDSKLWADLRCPQFAFLRWSHFQERTPYIWIRILNGLKLHVRNFQVVAFVRWSQGQVRLYIHTECMHTSRNIRNAGTISIYLLFCNPVKIYEVWSMKYERKDNLGQDKHQWQEKTRFSLGWKFPFLGYRDLSPGPSKLKVSAVINRRLKRTLDTKILLELYRKTYLALGWKCPLPGAEIVPELDNFSAEIVPKLSRPKRKSDILRTFSALILSGRGTISAEKWDIFSLLGWKCPQIIEWNLRKKNVKTNRCVGR